MKTLFRNVGTYLLKQILSHPRISLDSFVRTLEPSKRKVAIIFLKELEIHDKFPWKSK